MSYTTCKYCGTKINGQKAMLVHMTSHIDELIRALQERPVVEPAPAPVAPAPRIVWGKPATQPADRPAPASQGKRYAGNANKSFSIIERATKKVMFMGSMAECAAKLKAKRDAHFSMTLSLPGDKVGAVRVTPKK